jgi:L-aminopeptidase/D-esterase-like protein
VAVREFGRIDWEELMLMQPDLVPDVSTKGRVLEVDFPGLHIGIAEYREGPTGTTVFRFVPKAVGAVDVRGGAPGTYNTEWLSLGYSSPDIDAVVISGGSWYGLAAAGGVAAAMREDGLCSGHWTRLPNVAGAIIYDLGQRRLNEVHPDERLGAAALRAAKPGTFPLGAQGAGRMTMQGSYFGLWLHSGQGGAFRQIGETKLACFAVVNALGAIVDRTGRLAFGNQAVHTGERNIQQLIELVPDRLRTVSGSILGERHLPPVDPLNTTISLVVTNQSLDYAQLRRLAVQVHSSMGRGIQPFGTLNDGDVLFAATTCEVAGADLHPTDLGTIASEVMWDAVLSSIPDIPDLHNACPADRLRATDIRAAAGRYQFGPDLILEVAAQGRGLNLSNGGREFFGIRPGRSLTALGSPDGVFTTDSAFLQSLCFSPGPNGPVLILNPGPWQQIGLPTRL